MKHRCRTKTKNGKYYKGKGINYTPCWETFKDFYTDMGDCPKNYTLDRIDNTKDYCKENCRWASRTTQANNTSRNHRVTWEGETRTLSEWTKILGFGRDVLRSRLIVLKWPIKRAFTESVQLGKNQYTTIPNAN